MFTSVSCVRVVSHTGLAVVDTAATTISQSDRKTERQTDKQAVNESVTSYIY